MSKTIKIGGRIESAERGGVVTGANAILDDTKGKKQNVINSETDDELARLDNAKQDVLTFDNAPTEGSNNPVKSGGVYAADAALQQAIEAILQLIPSAATAMNQLADKAFVNSTVATDTATFRGTYNVVTDLSLHYNSTHQEIATALLSVVQTADNNDYCFVQIPVSDSSGDIRVTERYKFNGTEWSYEYDLNNSGFTADQWAAINSTITLALVQKLGALPTAAELAQQLATKQNTLTFDTAPVAGSSNPVTSGGLYNVIAAINATIPSGASVDNKLVAESRLTQYVAAIVNALDATFNVTSTDGHVNVRLTQVDGVITSVEVITNDIASASALNTLAGRVTTNEVDIAQLQALYNALQQSAPVIIQPTDTWPVANPSATVIYRVIDRVNTPPQYYSDYMFSANDLTTPVIMATYNNAIDPRPKKGSQNLVTSGGVFDNMGALDVSELNATENPHTLATYADLSTALAAIPSDYQKSGMSIKFVQSSDNKYIQARCMANAFTTDVTKWQSVDDEPTVGSDNLVKSGGVMSLTSELSAIEYVRVDMTDVFNAWVGQSAYDNIGSNGFYSSKIKVDNTKKVLIKSCAENTYYYFLKSFSNPAAGGSINPDFCVGYEERQSQLANTTNIYDIPSDCNFIVVGNRTSEHNYEPVLYLIQDDISINNHIEADYKNILNLIYGHFIALGISTEVDINNLTISDSPDWGYQIVEVVPGEKFEVKSYGGSTPLSYAIVDATTAIIEKADAGLVDKIVTIPDGGKYLIFQSALPTQNDYIEPHLYKYTQKLVGLNAVDNIISSKEINLYKDLVWKDHTAIIASDKHPTANKGDEVQADNYKTTDYIDCENCETLTLTVMRLINENNNAGLAFYNKDKVCIGGILPPYDSTLPPSVTNITYNVPIGAAYFRTTIWSKKMEQYGSMSILSATKKGDVVKDTESSDNNKYGLISRERILTISASDSDEDSKKISHIVCDGINDATIIQKAIDSVISCGGGKILFRSGRYIFNSIDAENCCLNIVLGSEMIELEGELINYNRNQSPGQEDNNGVQFYMSDTLYNGFNTTDTYTMLKATSDYWDGGLCMKNISLVAAHNQKKIIGIDFSNMSGLLRLDTIYVNCYNVTNEPNVGVGSVPAKAVEGSIGILTQCRIGIGAIGTKYEHIVIKGFYEGLAVNGEHNLIIACACVFCVYGYTFNHYSATGYHPNTLIKCQDERNVNLPKFYQSVGHGGGVNKQANVIIAMNTERYSYIVPGGILGELATEESVGNCAFGEISYTLNPSVSVNEGYWKDGHGHNMKSTNLAQKQEYSTSERLAIKPNFMQKVWDTDLNKEVICIDESVPTWVDCLGNNVDS